MPTLPGSTPPEVLAIDSLPDGVVISDASGKVSLVNRAAEQQLGMSRDEAIGRPLAEVLTLRDQDGAEWFATNCPYQGLHIRSGIPEQPWFLPNGHEVLVAARLMRTTGLASGRVAVSIRSGRGAPGSTASGPTWWPPWLTNCAPR